jgi:menaquinone-dependent protoporphyrinogen IX oxidase
MTVLVTAASEHGATREIAARIADDLARHDIDAEVKAPEQVDELSRYDASSSAAPSISGNGSNQQRTSSKRIKTSFVSTRPGSSAAAPSLASQ